MELKNYQKKTMDHLIIAYHVAINSTAELTSAWNSYWAAQVLLSDLAVFPRTTMELMVFPIFV